MSEVTRFSGMFATMAVDYSRSLARRVPRDAVSPQSTSPGGKAKRDDEHAVREAMERAISRRLRSKDAS
jgi:hypothetical protein